MSETAPQKPYVGLIPFHEHDAEFFFGREREREIITSNLMASRLTLLYGASGVGKSSVLHAGVAHHLRHQAQRDIKRRGKPKFTVVVFSAWRDEPIQSLIEHVRKAVMKTLEGQPVDPVAPNLSFVESLREWSRRVQGQLLIILDQFEEYFLYHPNEDGDGTFAVEFPRAVNTPGLPANFIVSYREDAHAKLDFFKGRIPELYDNYLRLGHLSYDAAYAAIKKPIERYNQLHQLDNAHQYAVNEDLTTTVLKEVKAGERYIGEAGQGVVTAKDDDLSNWEVETPYLQLVMTRLWETEVKNKSRTLQLETLTKLGGAKHIVQTHLDNAMSELSPKQRSMGANIFNYLVTPSGTKIAQTTHDLADYAELSTDKEKQLDEMMEKLTGGDNRILRSVPPPANQPNASRYEVFHDVLAQAILEWRRRFLARKARLRLLRVVGVMALIVLFMGGATVYAWQQRRVADVHRQNAERAAYDAQVQRKQAEEARRYAEEQYNLAQNARTLAEEYAAEADKAAEQEKLARQLAQRSEQQAKSAAESERLVAAENKELAASNKDLADKFEAAYESERRAKSQAQAAAQVAEEEKDKAQSAAQEAELQRAKAEEALKTVSEIDESNAYYKTVLRARSDVRKASFSKDGKKVVTISDDGIARLWDITSEKKPSQPTHVWGSESGLVEDVSFSPDDKLIVVVSNERDESVVGVATIWDVEGSKAVELDRLTIADQRGTAIMLFGAAFSRDGTSVTAYGTQEAKICSFDRPLRKIAKECKTLSDMAEGDSTKIIVSVSPDGRFLVQVTRSAIFLWDTSTGRKNSLGLPPGAASPSGVALLIGTKVAFSPDGNHLAIVSGFNSVHLYDTRTGLLRAEFKGDYGSVSKVAFSPDSKLLALAAGDGTARIWEVGSRNEVGTLRGHTAALTDVAFSPDGNYLLTASGDKTARVWDIRRATLFAELRGHINSVNSAEFSPDGNFVLTSGDKTARVWDVTRRAGTGVSEGVESIDNNATFDLDIGSHNPVVVFGVSAADLSWRYNVEPTAPGSSPLVTWVLNAENKAQIGFFSDYKSSGDTTEVKRTFDQIGVTELLGLNYSPTSITGGSVADRSGGEVIDTLPVGFIFAVRTTEGNYAKVQVVERGSTLKLRWITYKNPGPQQGPPRRADIIPRAGQPNDSAFLLDFLLHAPPRSRLVSSSQTHPPGKQRHVEDSEAGCVFLNSTVVSDRRLDRRKHSGYVESSAKSPLRNFWNVKSVGSNKPRRLS